MQPEMEEGLVQSLKSISVSMAHSVRVQEALLKLSEENQKGFQEQLSIARRQAEILEQSQQGQMKSLLDLLKVIYLLAHEPSLNPHEAIQKISEAIDKYERGQLDPEQEVVDPTVGCEGTD